MKAFNKIVLCLFGYMIFISCHKQTLPPSTVLNQPVFSFTGKVGTSILDLQAGVNNYYMYSSSSQDSSGVYSFIGTLQNTSTINNSIQIIINDYKVSKPNASVATHIDTSLSSSASYFYNTGVVGKNDTIGYTVRFTPHIYSGTADKFTYSFGDASPNTITTSAVVVTHTYTVLANYNTSLKVHFSSCSITDTIANLLNISKTKPQFMVDSINSSTGISPDSIAFTPHLSNGNAPYTYVWHFGDGDSLHTGLATISHTYTSTSVFPVNLLVQDKNNNQASYNYSVTTDSTFAPVCRFDYTMGNMTPLITVTNSLPLSDITIIYTDPTGKVYTSKNAAQPGGSNFQITSVSDYQNNINNQPTKMLKVTFDCTLYPTSGPSIQATGCTAVIAVAYK